MAQFMDKVKEKWNQLVEFTKDKWAILKEKLSKVNWKEVWDKFTTGLLIFLMASPFLILAYILLWFVLR